MSEVEIVDGVKTVPEASSAEPEKVEQGENQQQPAEEQVEEEPQAEDEGEKKRHGLSKRFSELTQKRREAEERAARLEQELAEVRAKAEKPESQEAKPKLDDFDSYDAYVEALSDWKARETYRREQSAAAEARKTAIEETKQAALQAEYQAKADIARSKYADFDAVAFRQDVPVSQPMVEAIMYSDHGAELQYFFGKNPEVAARIAVLSPAEALLAIGRLEAQIESQPAVKPTSAPAPISPVSARASAPKAPDEMTDEEYYAWRAAQKKSAKRF